MGDTGSARHDAWGGGSARRFQRPDWGLSAWRRAVEDAVRLPDRSAGQVTAVMVSLCPGRRVCPEGPGVAAEYGQVVLAEMVSQEDAQKELETLPDGQKMWTIGSDPGRFALPPPEPPRRPHRVRLCVFVWPASIIENYIMKEAEAYGIPFRISR
jgi:hypothetical protein